MDSVELGKLIESLPICSTKDDVRMRSAVVSGSFGPGGISNVTVEERIPLNIMKEEHDN